MVRQGEVAIHGLVNTRTVTPADASHQQSPTTTTKSETGEGLLSPAFVLFLLTYAARVPLVITWRR